MMKHVREGVITVYYIPRLKDTTVASTCQLKEDEGLIIDEKGHLRAMPRKWIAEQLKIPVDAL